MQNNGQNQQWSFLDAFSFLGTCIQILDYQKDLQEIGNDKLFEELQRQNKDYLERIIANQEEIIKSLSDLKDTRL